MSPHEWMTLAAHYGDYAAALAAREIARWPDFFTDDARYRIQSRENHERGLPLCTVALDGKGMLRDRAYGAGETIFRDPAWMRHIVGMPRVLAEGEGGVRAETSLLVIRTRRDALPEILFVGRSLDRLVADGAGWRFAERLCVFDNDLLPNSLIDPV